MDEAKAAAKRRKIYPKMQRAYRRALKKNPAGSRIIARFEQTSNGGEISALIASTVDVGHEMRRVDAKKKWSAELDVGSIYAMWNQDWGPKAVYALSRAINERDGTTRPEGEFFRSMNSQLEAFAGDKGMLNGEPNHMHFLREADPEEVRDFFQLCFQQYLDA